MTTTDTKCAFKVPVHYKSETNYIQRNQSTLNSHHIRASQAFRPDVKGLPKFHQMSHTKSEQLHAKMYSFAGQMISVLLPADSCQGKEVTKKELEL